MNFSESLKLGVGISAVAASGMLLTKRPGLVYGGVAAACALKYSAMKHEEYKKANKAYSNHWVVKAYTPLTNFMNAAGAKSVLKVSSALAFNHYHSPKMDSLSPFMLKYSSTGLIPSILSGGVDYFIDREGYQKEGLKGVVKPIFSEYLWANFMAFGLPSLCVPNHNFRNLLIQVGVKCGFNHIVKEVALGGKEFYSSQTLLKAVSKGIAYGLGQQAKCMLSDWIKDSYGNKAVAAAVGTVAFVSVKYYSESYVKCALKCFCERTKSLNIDFNPFKGDNSLGGVV